MAKPSEFNGNLTRNGIAKDVDPAGRPGHTVLTGAEKLRLMYRAGQDPDAADANAKPDPLYFDGLIPLPPGLKRPKYANPRPGSYVGEG